jgi:hypothetical protein
VQYLFISRIFSNFVHGVLFPFLQIAKRNLISFRAEKKEESNPFKQVFVFACYMKQSFTFQDLSENRRKMLKMLQESKFIWIRAPAAMLPAESANCTQSIAGCNTDGRT